MWELDPEAFQIQGYWGNQKRITKNLLWGFFITDSSLAAVKSHSPYFNTLLYRCVCFSICLAKATAVWWYIGCWILHVCVCICAGSSERASEWILITFARHELKWRSEWDARCSVLTAQKPDAPLKREAFSYVRNSSHINTSSAFQLYRALNDSALGRCRSKGNELHVMPECV